MEETKLRNSGNYEKKRKELFKLSKQLEISDIVEQFNEWIESNNTFVTEIGEVEDWEGGLNKSELKAKFKKELLDWQKHLEDM